MSGLYVFDLKTILYFFLIIFLKSLIVLKERCLIIQKKEKYTTTEKKIVTSIKYRLPINYSFILPWTIKNHSSIKSFKKIADDYIIGASIETLFFIYKKSKYQTQFNRFNSKSIEILSSKELVFDERLEIEFFELLQEVCKGNDLITEIQANSDKIVKKRKELSKINKKIAFCFLFIKQNEKSFLINLDGNKDKSFGKKWKYFKKIFKGIKVFDNNSKEYFDFIHGGKTVYEKSKKYIKYIEKLNIKANNLRQDISELEKNRNQLLDFFVIKHFIENTNGRFYLPYYFDFRGRIYSKSSISPINNKLCRVFIKEFKLFFDYDCLKKSTYFKKCFNLSKINLNDSNLLSNYKDIKLDKLSNFLIKSYLVELGKLNKVSFLNNKEGVSIDSFISQGILVFKNNDLGEHDIYDKFLIIKYKKAIVSTLNGDPPPWTVLRDATCSSFQH